MNLCKTHISCLGKKYWSDGTPAAGQQFEYGFDDIGNRKSAAAGGDQWGANLRYQNYTANNLNQYTQRTIPGGVDIIGAATNAATVTILAAGIAPSLPGATAGIYPTTRKGEYFRAEVLLNNSTGAVYAAITNLAVLPNGTNADIITTNIGNVLLPPTSEAFIYDADGNLLSDGVWTNRWDAENRLTSTESTGLVPSAARQKVDFKYDYRGRRIHKVVSTWNGSSYVPQSTNRFMYDDWNLLAVFPANNVPMQSFVWGQDLSGTMHGAGGVGGLLAVNAGTNGVHFTCFDGNGNTVTLVNASNATVSAEYEYSPFGELLRATGPIAKVNPFRFSTKFQDEETDLLYYGYRYYRPSTGRWLSRDPIGDRPTRRTSKRWLREQSNLYHFTFNNPVNRFDVLGLAANDWPVVTFPIDKLNCPSTCGPDYTASVNAELARLKTYLDNAPEWPGYYGNTWDLVNSGKLLNWFKNFAPMLNYDAQAKDAVQGAPLSGCPTVKCLGTITLCGKCVGSDVPGNIMFGYAAASFLSDIERDTAAFLQELRDGDGEPFEEDYDVFNIGKSLYEKGSTDICKAVGKLPDRKNRGDCSPCSKTASFSQAGFGNVAYPNYR